jgi:predicted DNA-binding transcriptional regulator AlpA
MPLFVCQECGTIENTALSRFWIRQVYNEPARCSACDPNIGEWHGKFPRQTFTGTQNVGWLNGEWRS